MISCCGLLLLARDPDDRPDVALDNSAVWETNEARRLTVCRFDMKSDNLRMIS